MSAIVEIHILARLESGCKPRESSEDVGFGGLCGSVVGYNAVVLTGGEEGLELALHVKNIVDTASERMLGSNIVDPH
jgi:hypothetical protein